ncbi:hypothetical protein AvCA_32640 [Azotobacter vinelandii CA]|uniref:Uncharacterized protein n=2 Tax=Azotobacter vinelandii TaxID=354 RepID=C1DP68_AZOVD|nr:hypothetical protein Avin_32640 [Azotobacter vinelandii DJ]AGK16385.1 hypothetical protein AvCA_32640 [Azotobacter vinelandii CA]AGK21214.1 hypothetical protein AvCA6_32640 [Azotobacter vinelandii CA6]GLK59466.1 hypothetical protein GCM10017624_16230 [Azotobacter vinelandii]SFX87803.1 hypothetical protein SAMN04244547_03062 [Azotobacter vinelandii]
MQPLFWTLPTGYLGGVAAAGGIALIGSLSTFAIAPGSTMAPLNARSGQAIETVTLKKVAGREVGGK